MMPELEILYMKSIERPSLTERLTDPDLVREYEKNVRRAETVRTRLTELLTGEEAELFQRFAEEEADCSDAERRMFFSQGLSIGLRLGSLCAWN